MKYLQAILLLQFVFILAFGQNTTSSNKEKADIKIEPDSLLKGVVKDTMDIRLKAKKDGNIVLSEKFQKALEDAFSFGPVQAPMQQNDVLTKEQLHEWVGPPTAQDTTVQPEKFDSTYKALKMWEKEFYVYNPAFDIPEIKINLGNLSSYAPHPSATLDINALGKYIRPKERRLYKIRKKADKIRNEMDALYPLSPDDVLRKK